MSTAARMVLALADCDRMLVDVPTVDAEWLVRTISTDRAVDGFSLALHLLRRALAREHARAQLAGMAKADDAIAADKSARRSPRTA